MTVVSLFRNSEVNSEVFNDDIWILMLCAELVTFVFTLHRSYLLIRGGYGRTPVIPSMLKALAQDNIVYFLLYVSRTWPEIRRCSLSLYFSILLAYTIGWILKFIISQTGVRALLGFMAYTNLSYNF